MITVLGRGDLTDEQWTVLEPLLPKVTRVGRPPVWSRRQLIDGIRFRVRTGVPWRDVPVEYGPWGRVYDLFRRWQRNGIWQRILTRLQSLADAKGVITWDLSGVPRPPACGRGPQARRPAEGGSFPQGRVVSVIAGHARELKDSRRRATELVDTDSRPRQLVSEELRCRSILSCRPP
ncbi:transposase [Streptomyces sp. NPDC057580]|uniref:transposase n=1 Tax=Streptomyces sp. NPDC057580 TaxID=3346173 RepID=UPI00367BB6CB